MTEDRATRAEVGVAMTHGSLRTRLLAALRSAALRVAELAPAPDLARRLAGLDVGLVVLRRRQLGADWEACGAARASAPAVAVVSSEHDPWTRASLMAAGAVRVLGADEPLERIVEHLGALARRGGSRASAPERAGIDGEPRLADFFTRSEAMRSFLRTIRKVIGVRSTLLVTGETGVGKERLARSIHAESPRRAGPFVSVNCGALPEHLLESELFGHEPGAFTGAAVARRGRFEEAHGGTLLLDEIGELPTHLQVKLLSVLQRGEVRRLGGERPRLLDVRMVAATHRDLRADVLAGRFREDLFYRLNVVPLHVPALRERAEDIPELVGSLVHVFRGEILDTPVRGVSSEALRLLMTYAWPGNVRELINVVERCMLLGESSAIEPRDLPPEVRAGRAAEDAGEAQDPAPRRAGSGPLARLEDVRAQAIAAAERAFLEDLLRASGGHLASTAERAGIGPRALYDKMRRYGLHKEHYR